MKDSKMADLSTTYLGLKLKNPIIVGSSGLTDSPDNVAKLEEAGAGAVVLKSIFEEEIMLEAEDIVSKEGLNVYNAETFDYYDYKIKEDNLSNFYKLIHESKKASTIPIIASVNCVSAHEWPYFAKKFEEAGADALELNVFTLPTDLNRTSEQAEKIYFDLIEKTKKQVSIPVSLKISYYFANLANMIMRLSETDIDGLVLFNRYYSPDFDIDHFKVTHANVLSSPDELYLSLRWIAIMSGRVQCDLASSTGVHDGTGVIKQLLAGANAVQVVSALYNKNANAVTTMLYALRDWMERHNFATIDDFRGKMSQEKSEDPAAYERIQFMKYFRGYETPQ